MEIVKSSNFGSIKCDFYMKDGEIFMTREQIGRALEYANPRIAISKIHDRNKGRLDKFSSVTKLGTPSGTQETIIYNERGIYEICRWSRQEKAGEFMDWVWDVVESIRKHGAYMTPDTIEKVLLNPDFVIQLATKLKEEQEEKERLKSKLIEAKPKLETYDRFMNGRNHMKIGHLAKMIGVGQNKLFKMLREMNILQSTQSDWNIPYQTYIDIGYFEVITKPIRQWYGYKNQPITLVTPKGAEWISKKLKERRSNKVIEFTG